MGPDPSLLTTCMRNRLCMPSSTRADAAADPAELYKLLGVATDASTADIKKAFRSMALLWHPDKKPQNPEATSRFRKISEAYSVRVDANKRHVYDLTEWSRDSEEDEV